MLAYSGESLPTRLPPSEEGSHNYYFMSLAGTGRLLIRSNVPCLEPRTTHTRQIVYSRFPGLFLCAWPNNSGLPPLSRKGQPCRPRLPFPSCRTLELTVFWLFDGAIKAFDYDVLVFLRVFPLSIYSKGAGGAALFFMCLEGPAHLSISHSCLLSSTYTLFCTFSPPSPPVVVVQSGACLVFHYLQPPSRCVFRLFGISLVSL